jgi:chromosome segregation ATPase
VQCLHELNIPVTEDEMTNPEKNKDQYKRILEHLTGICTGISQQEILQPAFSGLSVLMYPELHEESIPQINTFRACTNMMEVCGVQDFTIKDFIAPSAKRLRKQLSGIINFAKFREERLALLADLNQTRGDLTNIASAQRENHANLNNRLNTLREQTSEETKLITKIEGECKDIELNIASLNTQQEKTREHCAALKTRNNSLKDDIASRSLTLEEAVAERKRLSSQIVNSPERFRKQIVDVGQALQGEQKDSKAAERRIRELGVWIMNVEEARTEVNSALEAVHELRAEVERQKIVVHDFDMKRHVVSAKREALGAMEQKSLQLSKLQTRAEERLQHLRRQAAARSDEGKLALDDLYSQIRDAEGYRSQVRQRVNRAETEATDAEKEIEACVITQEQEYADMVSTYQTLEEAVVKHLHDLTNVMLGDENEIPIYAV